MALGLTVLSLRSASAREAKRPAPITLTDPAEQLSPLDLLSVTFGQRRDRFVVRLSPHGAWRPSDLDPAVGARSAFCSRGAQRERPTRACVRYATRRVRRSSGCA